MAFSHRSDKIILAVVGIQIAFYGTLYLRGQRPQPIPAPQTLSNLPVVAIGKHLNYSGTVTPPYTLVEFGDYQCGSCIQTYPNVKRLNVKRLLKVSAGRLKFEFRNLPLVDVHPQAMAAAEVAVVAQEQGNFWPVHDGLYQLKGHLDSGMLDAFADEFRLDKAKLKKFGAQSVPATIANDIADADKLGIHGTPTFVLCTPDGRVIKLADLNQVLPCFK